MVASDSVFMRPTKPHRQPLAGARDKEWLCYQAVYLRGTRQLRRLPDRLQLKNALSASKAFSHGPPSAVRNAAGIDRIDLLLQAREKSGHGASRSDGHVARQRPATEDPERFQCGSRRAQQGA